MTSKSSRLKIPIGLALMTGSLIFGVSLLSIESWGDIQQTDLFDESLQEAFTENLEDNFEIVSVPVSYETRINKGDAYFANEQFEYAAQEYAFAISIQEENPEAYAKLGLSYLELNQTEKALTQLEMAYQIQPNNADISFSYGLALLRNGDLDTARAHLLNLGDQEQKILYYQGMLQAIYQEDQDALNKWNAAASMTGPIPFQNINNFLEAYTTFQNQEDGQRIYLNALLIQALIDAEEYELAIHLALQTLEERQDYRDVWILLGYAQLKTKQFADAEEAFFQASQLDSLKPETYYFLGMARFEQEDYENAVHAFEKGLLHGFQPENELYYKIAEAYLYLERYEEALSSYEYLIQIEETPVDFYIRPIWIAIDQLQEYERAKTLAEKAISEHPSAAMSHNLLGWANIELGQLEQAKENIDLALDIDTDLAEAHYNLGRIQEAEDDLDGAQNSYKKAYELASEDNSIKNAAAEAYNAIILSIEAAQEEAAPSTEPTPQQ
jgi:tetratricopeptide (TPR) repeat protein